MTNATIDNEAGHTEELPKGTELMQGQFVIDRYLNAGGFGITYLATNSLHRQVVVKECYPETLCRRDGTRVQARSKTHVSEFEAVIRLFLKEAHALAKLKHPSIVGVHQVFEENGTAYMVLDYVKGSDLLTYIQQPGRVLMPSEINRILEKTLDAVGHVHAAGLLHRDISPDNIILTDAHEPILIDFGAARDQATKKTKALSALRVVKDGYSPQEFYLAGSAQGPSSDLYSLAATFYHVISGTLPPDSQLRLTAHVGKQADPYVPMARAVNGYEPAFCNAIDKALSVLPKDRFQNAAEWKAALEAKGGLFTPRTSKISKPVSQVRSRALSRATSALSDPKSRITTPTKGGRSKRILMATVAAGAVLALGLVFATDPGARTVPSDIPPTPLSEAKPVSPAAVPAAQPAVVQEAKPAPKPAAVEGLSITQVPEAWADGAINVSMRADLPVTIDAQGGITPDAARTLGLPSTSRLASINGESVNDAKAARFVLRSLSEAATTSRVPLTLGWKSTAGETVGETITTADIIYATTFANGTAFETRHVGAAWQTTVTVSPQGGTSSLEKGDILVALLNSDTRIADVSTLAATVAAALAEGAPTLDFAVRRNGALWTVSLPTSDLAR